VARQIHSLLIVEPATMASPNDCLNPDAAKYWLAQTDHAVPLDQPLGASKCVRRRGFRPHQKHRSVKKRRARP